MPRAPAAHRPLGAARSAFHRWDPTHARLALFFAESKPWMKQTAQIIDGLVCLLGLVGNFREPQPMPQLGWVSIRGRAFRSFQSKRCGRSGGGGDFSSHPSALNDHPEVCRRKQFGLRPCSQAEVVTNIDAEWRSLRQILSHLSPVLSKDAAAKPGLAITFFLYVFGFSASFWLLCLFAVC